MKQILLHTIFVILLYEIATFQVYTGDLVILVGLQAFDITTAS